MQREVSEREPHGSPLRSFGGSGHRPCWGTRAWAHLGGHRWRYLLEPADGGTLVIEQFDWSTAKVPWAIEKLGYPRKHPAAMRKTLDRLADVLAGRTADAR